MSHPTLSTQLVRNYGRGLPGSRGSGSGGGASTAPKPPPPGSPGGPVPLLPGRHTLVAQYAGDDVYERGVGVVAFDIDDGCGVL